MKEKIPPIEETKSEGTPGGLNHNNLEVVTPKNEKLSNDEDTLSEIKKLEYEIQFAQSPTGINAKKEKGDEQEGIVYNLPQEKKKSKGRLKTAVVAGFAGLMSMLSFKAKAGTGPEDSLRKNPLFGQMSPADSVESKFYKKGFEQSTDGETVGHITVESHTFIPQSDTTKEVFVYYFSDDGKSKNSLGEILNIMAEKGLKPADGELLEKIYNENKNNVEFQKKAKWVMAPTPENDEDDTKQNEKFLVSKNGKTVYVLPEHSVFRTINPRGLNRFELDQGFDSGEYGLLFYK